VKHYFKCPVIRLTRSWQLTAGQIGSNDYFRVADHPGTTPFVDTSAFIGTNPEALFPECRSLGNNGKGVRNGYITSKGWRAPRRSDNLIHMGMTSRDRTLVLILGSSRPVRPLADRNQKLGQSVLSVLKSYNQGARQARAPGCRVS
jgi:hypothetical protein